MGNEDSFDLKGVLAILYKGKKLIIGSILLCVSLAIIVAATMPELWVARVRVEQKNEATSLYLKLAGMKYIFPEVIEWAEFDKTFNSTIALRSYFKLFSNSENQREFFKAAAANPENNFSASLGSFSATESSGVGFSGELRFQARDAATAQKVLREYILFTDKTYTQQQTQLAKVLTEKKKIEFQQGILLLSQRAKNRSAVKSAAATESQLDMLKGNVAVLEQISYEDENLHLAQIGLTSELPLLETMSKPGVLITLGVMAGLFVGISLVFFIYYLCALRGTRFNI